MSLSGLQLWRIRCQLVTMGKRRKIIDAMHSLRLFDLMPRMGQLVVLSYHRLGAPVADFEFDCDVFGPTAEVFYEQMKWISKNATAISEAELLAAHQSKSQLPKRAVLITFDDAYIDQLKIGLPVLKGLGIPALYFISPGLIDSGSLGFWDVIARAVRLTHLPRLKLKDFHIELSDRSSAARKLTSWVKDQPGAETCHLVADIERLLEVKPAEKNQMMNELMNWEEIEQLLTEGRECGISVGSHGYSHRLLGKLAPADQNFELSSSKQRLEQRLRIPIRSLAYPAGSFSEHTAALAQANGYEAIFSFESGFNRIENLDAFDIKRLPGGDTTSIVACSISLPWGLGASYYP